MDTIQLQLLDIAARLTALANSLSEQTVQVRMRRRHVERPRTVPYSRFSDLLRQKYPFSASGHGSKRSFLDVAKAAHKAGTLGRRITEADEQQWFRSGAVPVWAYEYLRGIDILPQRPSPKQWTDQEIAYLGQQIRRYPHMKLDAIAERCTRRFGRPISEPAVKGMSDRMGISKSDNKVRLNTGCSPQSSSSLR